MRFYHGTTTLAGITDKLLPPTSHKFGTSEVDRRKNLDKVFLTTIFGYATTYARRSSNMKGGNPVVYEVEVEKGAVLMTKTKGLDIYYVTGDVNIKNAIIL